MSESYKVESYVLITASRGRTKKQSPETTQLVLLKLSSGKSANLYFRHDWLPRNAKTGDNHWETHFWDYAYDSMLEILKSESATFSWHPKTRYVMLTSGEHELSEETLLSWASDEDEE